MYLRKRDLAEAGRLLELLRSDDPSPIILKAYQKEDGGYIAHGPKGGLINGSRKKIGKKLRKQFGKPKAIVICAGKRVNTIKKQ